MDTAWWRTEVCRVGRSMFERGYVHATAGNISARLTPEMGGGFLITPTDACLGFLQADALAWVDDAGMQRSGDPASKTLALHRRIYASDPQARCIIHTHSTHLVALTLQGVWQADRVLPPITPYFVMKVGAVPLIPYRRPGHPDTADAVATALSEASAHGRRARAVLLDRLGPVAWAESPGAAMAVIEELEETARLWLSCNPRPLPLDDEQIAELRRSFNAEW